MEQRFRYHPGMHLAPGKKRHSTEGVRLILLQRRAERFSADRLDKAMQQAWKKEYDPQEFFAVAIPHDDGGILHAYGAEIVIRYRDYAIDWKQLGRDAMPFWAEHTAHTMVDYRCAKRPTTDTRRQMYRGLAMLACELASLHTVGFCFPHEQVLLPHSVEVLAAFRTRGPLDPLALESLSEG